MIKANRFRRYRKRVVAVLACAIVLCTAYALSLPAATLTGEPVCGLEEHAHGEECYEQVLSCGLEETEGHVHTEECCETQSVLICGLEEGDDHTHSADCFEEQSVPVCGLEETAAHVHTEDCCSTVLVCTVGEHTHEVGCYSDSASVEPLALGNALGDYPVSPASEGQTGTAGRSLSVTLDKASLTVSTSSKVGTMQWDETKQQYTLLTGDTMTFTASTGNTEGAQNYVYRLYLKKSDSDCTLNVTGSTEGTEYTFDGKTARCWSTSDPNVVFLEFTPEVGATVSVPIDALYPSPSSDGGSVTVWGQILSSADAANKTTVTLPAESEQITAVWSTKRDELSIKKTNNVKTVNIIGSSDGVARPESSLNWSIETSRASDTTSAYGKDLVTSVDFTDTLTLPAGLYWSQTVLDAVKNNNINVSGLNIYAGEIKDENLIIYMNASGQVWESFSLSLSADEQNVVLHWTHRNTVSGTEIGSSKGDIVIYPRALYADPAAIADSSTLTNTVNAAVHYTHTEDAELTASATGTVALKQGEIALTKTAAGGEYFGEDITYTLSLKNPGATLWTANDGAYAVRDSLSLYSYISPGNMERMFAETYGGSLTITITDATLAAWQQVTATDGTASAYMTSGNSNLAGESSGQTLTVTKSGSTYTVSVAGGSSYTSATAAGALQSAGYAVTPNAKYQCEWALETTPAVDAGQSREYKVYATAKDTFAMVVTDWPNHYPESEGNETVNVLNEASLVRTAAEEETRVKTASATTELQREANIRKSVYGGNGSALKSSISAADGEVLTYQLDFTHSGTGEYDNLPMVDDLYGSQYLLVPVSENTGLASSGLNTTDAGGVSCYILTPGSYTNVKVGTMDGGYINAATVTVETSDTEQTTVGGSYTGVHTQIKWYFSHLDGGSYTKSVRYQSLVDVNTTDGYYTLGNIVWMNDSTGNRIYDSLWGGGSLIEFQKKIVTGRGTTPAEDVLDDDDWSLIGEGGTVTYRIKLSSTGEGTYTLSGTDLVDLLPETYNVFSWVKDTNVTLEAVSGSGVTPTGLDSWSLSTEDAALGLTGDRQCMVWPDTSGIVFSGEASIYLYVTLTYPSDTAGGADTWTQYAAKNGGAQIDNTFYVFSFPDSVRHELSEKGSVQLRKGVAGIVTVRGGTYYLTGSDLGEYPVPDYEDRYVFYYVTLYNGGNKRLYISDLQDRLPDNFSYAGLLPADFNPTVGTNWDKSGWTGLSLTDTVTTQGGSSSRLVSIESADAVSCRSAAITSAASADKKSVSFAVSAGTGDNALKYDSERQQYYLDCGEALVFGYAARVGSAQTDASTNVIAMPYTDYLSTGVEVDGDAYVTGKVSSRYSRNNDGLYGADTSDNVTAQYGFTAVDGVSQWLYSDVDMKSGSIVPGITKFTDSYTTADSGTKVDYTGSVSPTDTVKWRLVIENSGTTGMTDYTVTDVMPKPYLFTGSVYFILKGNNGISYREGEIVYIEDHGSTDSAVTVARKWKSSGDTALNIGGDAVTLGESSTELLVSMSRDDSGNEVLSLRFKGSAFTIPEGCSLTVDLYSKNPTTTYENRVYTNLATVTPNVQSFTEVGQGSMVRDGSGKPVSVTNSSPVTVSFGYATSSVKRVTESSNTANTAASTDTNNKIRLSSADSDFTYTLTVSNDTDKAMNKLVIMDSLPEIGDTSPFDGTAARGSEFTVNFASEPNVTVKVTKEDGDSYTVDDATVEYCASKVWSEPQSDLWKGEALSTWSTSMNPADARAVRITIKDSAAGPIPAKAKVEVSFTARVGSDAEAGKVAWNSFGYHYSLEDVSDELEAMPLTVGVMVPPSPSLQKLLVDGSNQPVAAEQDESFRFLIHEGEAVDYTTEEELRAALNAAGRGYTEVTVTVKSGQTQSEAVRLGTSDISWTDGQRYTAVELTSETDGYRLSGFEGGGTTCTFTFSEEAPAAIVCTNAVSTWDIQVKKVDPANENADMSGAVFALYSPAAEDALTEVPAGYTELGIQLQLTQTNSTYYLCGVQTVAQNLAEFTGLAQERYWLLEVRAPDDYCLPSEPGQPVLQSDAVSNVLTVTVENLRAYTLPDTGGRGTLSYAFGGAVLTAGGLLGLTLGRRRRKRP